MIVNLFNLSSLIYRAARAATWKESLSLGGGVGTRKIRETVRAKRFLEVR